MQNAGSGPKAACKAHTPGGKALRRPSGAAPSSPPQALRKGTEGAAPVDSHTRAAGRGSKALFDEQTPSSALPGSPGPAQPSVCVPVRIKAPHAILPSPGEPLVVPGWALAAASPLPELLEVTFVPSLGSRLPSQPAPPSTGDTSPPLQMSLSLFPNLSCPHVFPRKHRPHSMHSSFPATPSMAAV